jgi:uncharacterized protein (TIGR03083 family)
MEQLVRDQWAALRLWLDAVDVLGHGEDPSGLPEWSITQLVAHLGFGLVMLDEVRPAPPDAEALPVGDYIAQYRPAAETIAVATNDLAAKMPDVLDGIDLLAARAWAALEHEAPSIVLGRRGPITHDDFLLTRLLELVVHGEDLRRAIGAQTTPVLPEAEALICEVLERAYTRRGGQQAIPGEPKEWIRLATGRDPSVDPHLPLL